MSKHFSSCKTTAVTMQCTEVKADKPPIETSLLIAGGISLFFILIYVKLIFSVKPDKITKAP